MATEKEFEAETEREALDLACAEFGVSKDELDYSILDMGSAGLFGMGARPVKISASVVSKASKAKKAAPAEDAPKKAKKVEAAAQSPAETEEASEEEVSEEEAVEAAPEKERPARSPGIVGPAPEKAAQAKEVAEALCNELNMAVNIEVRDEETEIVIVLSEVEESTAVADLLGSTRPPALPSLQFLLNKIVNRFPDNRKHIVVEAVSVSERIATRKAEAAERRKQHNKNNKKTLPEDIDEEMVAIARSLVEKANALGKVITILPMAAGDRRAIHQTVMTIEDAETVSEGDGLFRRIHVVPEALRTKRTKSRRRRRRGGRPEDGAESSEEASAAEATEAPVETAEATEAVASVDDVALANATAGESAAETEPANV